MSTLSVQLPDSLHEKVLELAARDHVSVDQFITVAVAEKMSGRAQRTASQMRLPTHRV